VKSGRFRKQPNPPLRFIPGNQSNFDFDGIGKIEMRK
jgi:hypothetical protein